MTNIYAWAATQGWVGPIPPGPSALVADIRSVGDLWVVTAYDDLRPAGLDRATQVRWILNRHVNPWFAPQTGTLGDTTCFRVHAWLCWMYWSRGPYSFMGRWHRTSSPDVTSRARFIRYPSDIEAAHRKVT